MSVLLVTGFADNIWCQTLILHCTFLLFPTVTTIILNIGSYDFLTVGCYYTCHIMHATIAKFNSVFVKYFIKTYASLENACVMFKEYFAYVCFHIY